MHAANGDILKAEKELDDGQIEEVIMVAEDELKVASNMAEWKLSVYYLSLRVYYHLLSNNFCSDGNR